MTSHRAVPKVLRLSSLVLIPHVDFRLQCNPSRLLPQFPRITYSSIGDHTILGIQETRWVEDTNQGEGSL